MAIHKNNPVRSPKWLQAVRELEYCVLCGAYGVQAAHRNEGKGAGMICRGHCFNNGLIMRAVGDRMIIAPPLTITHAQIDELIGLIRKVLDLTLADARAAGWMN